jgi:hypothetical protein
MSPIGHFALGLAAKPVAPKIPLWVLLIASDLLDLLCFPFFAAGIEHNGATKIDFNQGLVVLSPSSIPWSHGLLMSIVWSVLFGLIGLAIFKDRKASIVAGLVVFSHWALDFIVHPPDLPLLFSDSPKLGLGLWSSGPGFIISLILEIALFAAGLTVYLRTRKTAHALVSDPDATINR